MKQNLLDKNMNTEIYSLLSKNAYHIRMPSVKSTGFRLQSLRHNERETLNNLAEEYLVNSYLKRNDPEIENSIAAYLQEDGMKLVSMIGTDDLSAFETIALDEGVPLDLAIGDAMTRRRSIRDFTGDQIDFTQLTTLLRAVAGVSAKADVAITNGNLEFNIRTVPSGGGLYPIDLYVIALNIQDLSPRVYRYQPIQDNLICMGDKNKMQALVQCFSGNINMIETSHASLIFLYVARPWRSMRKYGNRGLRFVFHEVGAMSQNLHLAVTALGLGSVDCASFYEDEIHQVLGFDGVCQTVVHSTLVGVAA